MTESAKQTDKKKVGDPIVSRVLPDGRLIELGYDAKNNRTQLIVGQGEKWSALDKLQYGNQLLIPYSPKNNLIRHNVVLLPTEPEPYDSQEQLISEIRAYLRRYVDLPEDFETVAAYYALFTWVYDRFNEVPYLRLTGDFGTGKTRFLLVLGSIVYKPMFASGASTISPIFHGLDSFRGTLVMDEADFRFSDEKSDVVKILNNGNVAGFPILRCQANDNKEFSPKAFNVFGPKIVATRGHYEDPALESRFITCNSSGRSLRSDIPINLEEKYKDEAQRLRNKLLAYRLRKWSDVAIKPELRVRNLESRVNQIFLPILSIIQDNQSLFQIVRFAVRSHETIRSYREIAPEKRISEIISELQDNTSDPISVGLIADEFRRRHSEDFRNRITNKWIGSLLRTKLHLRTRKNRGVYVIE